jgi:hypothetical protein
LEHMDKYDGHPCILLENIRKKTLW